MKRILLIIAVLVTGFMNAQVIGADMIVKEPKTTAEMNAITVAQGLAIGAEVRNSDTGTIWWYNGTIWVDTGSAGSADWPSITNKPANLDEDSTDDFLTDGSRAMTGDFDGGNNNILNVNRIAFPRTTPATELNWLFSSEGPSDNFFSIQEGTGTYANALRLHLENDLWRFGQLSGVGTRMVVADDNGELSAQAIPSGGSSDNLGNHTATQFLDLADFGITFTPSNNVTRWNWTNGTNSNTFNGGWADGTFTYWGFVAGSGTTNAGILGLDYTEDRWEIANSPIVTQANAGTLGVGADGLGPDGDKGDITVGGSGTTLSIDADAVTTLKIADDAITTAKILNQTITSNDIAIGGVTSANLLDDSILPLKLNNSQTLSGSLDGYVWTYTNATNEFTLVDPTTLGGGTDDQTLSLAGTGNKDLTIETGNTVDLTTIDGIDPDNLQSDGTGRTVDATDNIIFQTQANFDTDGAAPSGTKVFIKDAEAMDGLTAGTSTIDFIDANDDATYDYYLDNTTNDVVNFTLTDMKAGYTLEIYLNQASEPSFTPSVTIKTGTLDWTTDSLANTDVTLTVWRNGLGTYQGVYEKGH